MTWLSISPTAKMRHNTEGFTHISNAGRWMAFSLLILFSLSTHRPWGSYPVHKIYKHSFTRRLCTTHSCVGLSFFLFYSFLVQFLSEEKGQEDGKKEENRWGERKREKKSKNEKQKSLHYLGHLTHREENDFKSSWRMHVLITRGFRPINFQVILLAQ